MSEERKDVLLVTPIPPVATGLATYAMRVLQNSLDFVNWTVAYPEGGDPGTLTSGIRSIRIDQISDMNVIPEIRIFQLGNSIHCFPVVQALYRYGGTGLFHEIVLHHMLRFCYLESNQLEEYRRELRFCYGPNAESIEKELFRKPSSLKEYDILLKRYPLIGRALHASSSAICLSSYAETVLKDVFRPGRTCTIGHPLSSLPEIDVPEKPFDICIGILGSNHPGRNYSEILEAVELFRKETPEAGLILIGGGYPEDNPEWVINCGRLPDSEYQGWIRTLDYAVDMRYPACGETSGSLLEAMRAGVPCIVSATGTFLNIPSDAVLRVPCDSMVQGIVRSLSYLHNRSDLRKSMSANCISYAEDTGSIERLRRDWKRIIRMASESGSDDLVLESNSYSLSAAWHETPPGFTMDISTEAVSWKYSGDVLIEGPPNSTEAEITVCGTGSVNGTELPIEPGVMSVKGKDLSFTGEGRVFCVLWKYDRECVEYAG
ncbi:MAG: glycosyltransferase [Candidatus Aegiribacteria sp.]|nr:glycosyltransferase [Candidatus Aegiribacteria sp.]